MKRAAASTGLLALALLAGCDAGAEDARTSPFVLPPFELAAVVATALRELESELAPGEPAATAEPEHVRGLVSMLVGTDAGMREVAREEALALGDACVSELLKLANDVEAPLGERQVAFELLAQLDTWRAGEALVVLLETSEETWARAHAAWRLGATTQDWVVPRLYLRLKYETDHDTVIWLARTLAHFGNYSGLLGLNVVAQQSGDEKLRASASARMTEAIDEAGFASVESLWEAWASGQDAEVFRPTRSARFDLELWRRVERLREFQLRGVDDSRYVFEGLGAHTATLLARALHDENVYIRVHCAQGLQRMGPRAAPAGATLIEALGEPELAPHAAAALGAIGHAPAVEALIRCLAPAAPPDLRLASARALGGFGDEEGAPALDPLRALQVETEAEELRQAAAESLAWLGQGDEVAEFLAACLTSDRVEPVTSENALRHWLAGRAQADEAAALLLAEWDALVIPNDTIVSPEQKRASRVARQALIVRSRSNSLPVRASRANR